MPEKIKEGFKTGLADVGAVIVGTIMASLTEQYERLEAAGKAAGIRLGAGIGSGVQSEMNGVIAGIEAKLGALKVPGKDKGDSLGLTDKMRGDL